MNFTPRRGESQVSRRYLPLRQVRIQLYRYNAVSFYLIDSSKMEAPGSLTMHDPN